MNSSPFIKNFLSIISLLAALISVSCKKVVSDDADAFVGDFAISVIENSHYDSKTGILPGSIIQLGTLHVTKVSANEVLINGYVNTVGEVDGNDITFKKIIYRSSYTEYTTVFEKGTLKDGELEFTSFTEGQTMINGVMCPYTVSSSWTCIKQ